MRHLLTVAGVSIIGMLTLFACRGPMGMMGGRGSIGGPEMMAVMREPGMMESWMDEMVRDPEMMGRMMSMMQQRFRGGDSQATTLPLYCPMMGFTPDSPPAPEAPYERGSLSSQELFQRKCSRCHALPDPALHTQEEWTSTVERMAGYIDSSGFVTVEPTEIDAILEYLRENASAAVR